MRDLERRRVQLEARKSELAQRLMEIDAELDSHQSKDWDDAAIEQEADEVLEGMGASGKAEMAMIDAALARMDSGDYGICARCGDEISDKRLDVLPYTPVCMTCATQHATKG
nr:TraR/DksA family transcriptional regulator [uncultured Celeribacter sp.]